MNGGNDTGKAEGSKKQRSHGRERSAQAEQTKPKSTLVEGHREDTKKRGRKRGRESSDASRKDAVGLYPIHWAALKNRRELVERLLAEDPSSAGKRCSNKLFANGTPLHLAAMNGSLEAACAILSGSQADEESVGLLEALDADGQTPLMRSAAPRTRRWNTIRELMQKNFWSLSGRPAEMALFLIATGADWRKTEPINGMNLMHLAIMNDYDDIVSLLLVLDRRLVNEATLKPSEHAGKNGEGGKAKQQTETDKFKTIALDGKQANAAITSSAATTTTTTTTTTTISERSDSSQSSTREPLIDSNRQNANDLIERGLKPLQLAVLYGRVKLISLLWRPRRGTTRIGESDDKRASGSELSEADEEESLEQDQTSDRAKLKRLLIRACFSDNEELAKFLKPLLLKALLAIDLAAIALLWAPAYCLSVVASDADNSDDQHHRQQQQRQHLIASGRPSLRGGIFFVSYCLAMALTLRVMLKNPGFLRRHSVHYLSELAKLLSGAPKARETIASRLGKDRPASNEPQTQTQTQTPSQPVQGQASIKPPPLLRLDDTTSILLDNKQANKQPTTYDEDEEDKSNKVTTLAMARAEASSSGKQPRVERLADKLREVQLGVRHLCHRCQCIRRPRSKHCNYCDHCVQDFDHHCIYLGCCIGRNNRLDFLLAMIALAITSIYGTILQSFNVNQQRDSSGAGSRFWHLVAFVWIFKYALIGGAKAFCMLRRACLGVTLYEEARSRNLRAKFGRRGPPAAISKHYPTMSTLSDGAEGSFWRYLPHDTQPTAGSQRYLRRGWLGNLREFANYTSPDEYLLTLICTDTPLARSLLSRSSDLKIKQQQQQQQLHKLA